MAPHIPTSKLTLSYPIYACDFDSSGSSTAKLVVGGGGGSGRNGVENKITVLNVSQPDAIKEVCEISLNPEEDNVTSLAAMQNSSGRTIIYAGINSKPRDLENGINEHFKIFGLEGPKELKKKSSPAKISELRRAQLFEVADKDGYQRILRLSRPYPKCTQLGAIATSLARTPEIVIFDTSASKPTPNILGKVNPTHEAEDVDIIQIGDQDFEFAYCDKRNIYTKKISKKTENSAPVLVYSTPGEQNATLPSFRSLRYLTPGFLLMLTNVHSNAGVALQVLRLNPDRKVHARSPLSKRLPQSLKKATGLAVVNLSPPSSPGEKQDVAQFVVAVAGHDCSISILTLEYQKVGNVDQFANLRSVRVIESVHPNILTSITFSNFIPPPHPVTGETKPQYLKLASVSMVNTVVVHTLPLSPLPISTKVGQSKTPRYVLTLPCDKSVISLSFLVALFAITLGLVATQGLLEYQGVRTSYLGLTKSEVARKWTNMKAGYAPHPHIFDETPNLDEAPFISQAPVGDTAILATAGQNSLKLLLQRLGSEPGVVVIREEEEEQEGANPTDVKARKITAGLHDEAVKGPHGGRTWQTLSPEEKEAWLVKLRVAGHWVEEMGETILKGVVFSQLGDAVGSVVTGVIS